MKSLEELFDLTLTSRYGENILDEINAEVALSILTPSKSLPYYREYGSLAKTRENTPLTITRLIKLQTSIYRALQTYNDDLTSKDERRVAITPDQISFETSNQLNGDADVFVPYTPLRIVDTDKGSFVQV